MAAEPSEVVKQLVALRAELQEREQSEIEARQTHVGGALKSLQYVEKFDGDHDLGEELERAIADAQRALVAYERSRRLCLQITALAAAIQHYEGAPVA